MEIKIKQDMLGKYWAEVWLVRECYTAQADTEEAAINKLREHLSNIIPIYENDIAVAQERISAIKDILSKSPVQG